MVPTFPKADNVSPRIVLGARTDKVIVAAERFALIECSSELPKGESGRHPVLPTDGKSPACRICIPATRRILWR